MSHKKCGCFILCSEHKAAPAMRKALVNAGEYYEMLEEATGIEHPVLKEIRAALDLAAEKKQ